MVSKIDKDIPIPERNVPWKKYPWGDLEIGESFFEPCRGDEPLSSCQTRVYSAAHQNANRTGKKYSTRMDYDEEGVRVWRIK